MDSPVARPRPAAARAARSAAFWTRALRIWAGYKGAQARIALLRRARGHAAADAAWARHHDRAGDVRAQQRLAFARARGARNAMLLVLTWLWLCFWFVLCCGVGNVGAL